MVSNHKKFIGLLLCSLLLLGCESENEHFCSKYSYFYKELTAPGILPIRDLRAQLERERDGAGADRQRARMALFVLDEIQSELKPEAESARDYCLRRKRWERFH